MSVVLLSACASTPRTTAAEAACDGALLDIEGHRIWARKQGTGSPTVVFESGFGNDSTVWTSLEKQVREKGFQTFVYDRAGLGKSTLSPTAVYSLDNDAGILGAALERCGIQGPLVVVGHSYGGAIGLVLAEKRQEVKGLVLLDAVVPGVWGQGELEKNLVTMRSQYEEIRRQAPALAKVAIPWAEALPVTVERIDHVALPVSLPIIDVVAEAGQNSPESAAVWREAHQKFVGSNPNRTYVLAKGSSHKVMNDGEPLVLDSIVTLIGRASR
ncbi:alpha/beta fold hydrolase [Myxococcus sp. K15C18031901]|uniref:alpha/beta fold hydrolase n=1 Tax=Myxococcus dinghuensis TaxID=2906761 RepID=UPI0020A757AC|nr:alpha/beta hydrolase family protein [Myxococcus dinghuensis]MCP3100463.1 alpha/beta fold hydrolase [Myxococcus dinghuensis]